MILLLAACSEQTFSQLTAEEIFEQNRKNTVDLLVVVDNSCSMIEEQANLADNFDSFITTLTEADIDWQLGVVTTDTVDPKQSGKLRGGDDELVLYDPDGVERDAVEWDSDWGAAPGQALALDPSWFSAISNGKSANWCAVGTGSPGTVNPSCGLALEGSGSSPNYGAILFTEFMADPDAVADDAGEWFELTNIADVDVDLSGYTLADGGRNTFAVPDGTVIAAGASLVFGRSADTALNGGVPVNVAVGDAITLNNDVKILSGAVEGQAEIFSEMVALGTSGTGIEMGFEAARLAFQDKAAEHNAGFLREEANLSILILSDEEDSSPDSVDTYLRDFADLKGEAAYRDHTLMNVSGVVGDEPPEFKGDPSCASANGVADYGHRYIDAIEKTEGLSDSICASDYSQIMTELGVTISGLIAEFELRDVPILETLEVSLYADRNESSKIKDLTIDVDFSYNRDRNAITFQYDQVPESQQIIRVVYTIQSGSG